ncbi:MAG: sulfite exporter TauE/SafE family protein [Planctomycetota bacterium]
MLAADHALVIQDLVALGVLGLCAGILGGLLGIGGSILMIPALKLLIDTDQHLAQAAAMIVNLFVALPAMLRHLRNGAVRWDVVLRMLPFGVVTILAGVELSNVFDGRDSRLLTFAFGLFLIYVILVNVRKLIARTAEPVPSEQRPLWRTSALVGGIVGFFAGLLGIGGGVIAVPLLQRVCKLPLRQCIATSCALMCLTAGVGGWRKNATLSQLVDSAGDPIALSDSLRIAACLAPTAIIGGLIGASLTHRISLRWLRIALILVMTWASAKMLGAL